MGHTLDLEESSLILDAIDLHHDVVLEGRHPDLRLELNLDREGSLGLEGDILILRCVDREGLLLESFFVLGADSELDTLRAAVDDRHDASGVTTNGDNAEVCGGVVRVL